MKNDFKSNLKRKTQRIMWVSSLRGFLITMTLLCIAYYAYMARVFFVPQLFYFSKFLQHSWWIVIIVAPIVIALISGVTHFQDEDKLVMSIETQYPHLRDRLQTALEMSKTKSRESIDPFSAALARSLEHEMNQILNRFGFHRLTSFKNLIIPAAIFVALFTCGITHAMLQPHFFRLHSPMNTVYESPLDFFKLLEKKDKQTPLFEIIVKPGHCEVGRGQNLFVQVNTPNFEPKKVYLYLKHPSDAGWRVHEMQRQKDGSFQYQLTHIIDSGIYFVGADKQQSEKYKITIYEPLAIERVAWKIVYPQYTRLAEETRQGWGTKFSVPLNSQIKLELKTNRPVKKANLISIAKEKTPLTVSEDGSLQASLEITRDEILKLELFDENDQIVLGLPSTWIQVVPDLLPYLEVLQPQNHNYTFPTEEIPFEINLDDDYGIKSVALVMRYQGQEQRVEWLTDGTMPKVLNLKPILQLEKFNLKSRDMIFAHVEIQDNYPDGEHVVKSELFSFLIRDYVEQFKLNTPENKEVSLRKLFEGVLVEQEKIMSDAWDYLSRLPTNGNPVLAEKSAGGYSE